MFRLRYRILPLSLVAVIVNVKAGDVYRWVDENGTVTYSATKPVGQVTQELAIGSSPSVRATQPSVQDLVTTAKKTSEERLERTKEDADKRSAAETRDKLCQRASSNLEGMENNVRSYHVDQSGERVRIGEEQRQEDIAKLQALVKKYCD